jgi:hypothetical protein
MALCLARDHSPFAIIDIAATGERDPDRLCERVLSHLKEPDRAVA